LAARRAALRHVSPVEEEHVAPVRQRVDDRPRVGVARHLGDQRAGMEHQPGGLERVRGGRQHGAPRQSQVVRGPRFHERTEAGNVIVLEETEVHSSKGLCGTCDGHASVRRLQSRKQTRRCHDEGRPPLASRGRGP
jgi:hypothetical protein